MSKRLASVVFLLQRNLILATWPTTLMYLRIKNRVFLMENISVSRVAITDFVNIQNDQWDARIASGLYSRFFRVSTRYLLIIDRADSIWQDLVKRIDTIKFPLYSQLSFVRRLRLASSRACISRDQVPCPINSSTSSTNNNT